MGSMRVIPSFIRGKCLLALLITRTARILWWMSVLSSIDIYMLALTRL